MVELQLNGEVRKMRFSHIAIKSLENHYNMTFHEIFKKINMDSVENIGVMLWASLRKHDRSLTLDEVEDWIDDGIDEETLSYEELGEKIKEVFNQSTLARKGKEEKNKKRA